MTQSSGSFVGEVVSQTTTTMTDEATHVFNLAQVEGQQSSSDDLFDGAALVYWGVADLVAGNGSQRGYFVNTNDDGDRNFGTFEGQVTTSGDQITLDGQWQFGGGTGVFEGIQGGGGYHGQFVSPTALKMEWDGEYKL